MFYFININRYAGIDSEYIYSTSNKVYEGCYFDSIFTPPSERVSEYVLPDDYHLKIWLQDNKALKKNTKHVKDFVQQSQYMQTNAICLNVIPDTHITCLKDWEYGTDMVKLALQALKRFNAKTDHLFIVGHGAPGKDSLATTSYGEFLDSVSSKAFAEAIAHYISHNNSTVHVTCLACFGAARTQVKASFCESLCKHLSASGVYSAKVTGYNEIISSLESISLTIDKTIDRFCASDVQVASNELPANFMIGSTAFFIGSSKPLLNIHASKLYERNYTDVKKLFCLSGSQVNEIDWYKRNEMLGPQTGCRKVFTNDGDEPAYICSICDGAGYILINGKQSTCKCCRC
jgi:hypothetical protein